MFERRLKILLLILALFTFVLLVRAGQIQLLEHQYWTDNATKWTKHSKLIDADRGRILDRNKNVLAADKPCVDVCVDYRAIVEPLNIKWIDEQADHRLKSRLGDEYTHLGRSKRKELIASEADSVRQDIGRMWAELIRLSGMSADDLEEVREAIIRKVQMRKRIASYHNYSRAIKATESRNETEAFWRRWLVEGIAGEKNEIENYTVSVAEESEAHVILKAISVDQQNYLGKYADRFPGLELRPSTHRAYPFGSAACHLIGRVSRVNREDLLNENAPREETRQYLPNDQIGRGGIEALCEKALRGTKGKIERVPGQTQDLSRTDPQAGNDIRITIDVNLQSRIEQSFTAVELPDAEGKTSSAMFHGAAVVLDVATGDVLALASYPTYDLNTLDELYQQLSTDEINQPLMNRATLAQLQPGSTIKPVVGLSAISQGVITPDAGIECTGYLVLDGKKYGVGRCWVASRYKDDPRVPSVSHHPIPSNAPHPTGWLTFGDALERSCNVYFETLADRMGMEGLSLWYERFGLGRPTGLGIAEARGRLPRSYVGPLVDRRYKTWFSGIGQDPVSTTPIQMANVAATVARGGIWMRPRLIARAESDRLGIALPVLRPAPQASAEEDEIQQEPENWPDAYDLNLAPAAVAAARDGMHRVVYGAAGSGKSVATNAPALNGINICGKTGTAQAPKFSIRLRDPKTGKPTLTAPRFEVLEPSTPDHPNALAPWYRAGGKKNAELAHAWYIGFAPAENPKIAFAVMVEYGGSGGGAAAAVAKQALINCVELGYLKREAPTPEAATRELLRDIAVNR